MYAPMLIPLAGMVAGIFASMLGATIITGIAVGIMAIAFQLLLSYFTRDPLKGYRFNRWHHAWIFLIFGAIGICSADLQRPYQINGKPEDYIAIQGHVTSISSKTNGDKALIDVNRLIRKDGTAEEVHECTIVAAGDMSDCETDDDILITAPLAEIADSQETFTRGYADRLHREGIFYHTRCDAETLSRQGHTVTLKGISVGLRNKLESLIEGTPLAKETQNFLITILLGDRDYLDPYMRDLFADAGISHILALSGMHVAIIAGLFMWLLFPMNFMGLYRHRLLATLVLLGGYAFITGMGPSIMRATLMTACLITCIFLERKNTAWNSLLTSAFIILVFSPYAVLDVGFQLSFLCVASLIFFVRPLNPIDQHQHPKIYNACSLLLTTLVANIATWCLSAFYFGKIPLLFLVANMIALPLLPAYLVAVAIYLTLHVTGLAPIWSDTIIDAFPRLLSQALLKIGAGESAIVFSPSAITLLLWIAVITIAAVMINGKNTLLRKISLAVTATAFLISLPLTADAGPKEGFIFNSHYDRISVITMHDSKENEITMPRKKLSVFTLMDQRIAVLDCDLKEYHPDAGKLHCDYLIIAGGCRQEMGDILKLIKCGKVVIHTSVRRARERRLTDDAIKAGIPLHSIRQQGPLRFNAPPK